MMKLALSLLPLLALGQFTGPGFDIKATNPADLPQWGNTWNQTFTNGTTVWSSKNAVKNVIPTYAISQAKVVAGAAAPAMTTFNGKYYSCLMNGGLWDSSAKTCAASTTTGQYSYKNIFAGLLVPGTKSKQGTNLAPVNFCSTTTVTNNMTASVTTTYSWITPNSSTPTATIPANYFCAIQLGKEEVGYASTIQISGAQMYNDFAKTHDTNVSNPSMNTLVSLEYVNKDGYDMTYQNTWTNFKNEKNASYSLVNSTNQFQTGWMNEHHGRFQQIVFLNNFYTSTGSVNYKDFYAKFKNFKVVVVTPAPGFFHRTAAKIIQTAKNNSTLIIILVVVAVLAVGGAVGGYVHHMRKAHEAAKEIRTTEAKQDDSQRNMINMMNIEKSADVPKDKQ